MDNAAPYPVLNLNCGNSNNYAKIQTDFHHGQGRNRPISSTQRQAKLRLRFREFIFLEAFLPHRMVRERRIPDLPLSYFRKRKDISSISLLEHLRSICTAHQSSFILRLMDISVRSQYSVPAICWVSVEPPPR